MKASELDWGKLPDFAPGEWPDGVLDQMQARVVQALQDIRTAPLVPSPVAGAHVREHGTSEHSTDGGRRLANATDFFVAWRDLPHVAAEALAHPDVNGIGVYNAMRYNGEPGERAMMHIDCRPAYRRAYWLGEGREPVTYTTVSAADLSTTAHAWAEEYTP
jgi:hypothetical protein